MPLSSMVNKHIFPEDFKKSKSQERVFSLGAIFGQSPAIVGEAEQVTRPRTLQKYEKGGGFDFSFWCASSSASRTPKMWIRFQFCSICVCVYKYIYIYGHNLNQWAQKRSNFQNFPSFIVKNDPEKPPHLVWGFFTFQCFLFFLIFAFPCLIFSSFPLLLGFLKPKSGPSNEVISIYIYMPVTSFGGLFWGSQMT